MCFMQLFDFCSYFSIKESDLNKNIDYINTVKVDDIAFAKLFGAYNVGNDIASLLKEERVLSVDEIDTIAGEIEHQDTFFPITPFALIFLARALKYDYKNNKDSLIALLELFVTIADDCVYLEESFTKDLNDEKLEVKTKMQDLFLAIDKDRSQFKSEDEFFEYIEECLEDESYLYSVFFYTYLVLKQNKETFKELKNHKDKEVQKLSSKVLSSL